MSQHVDLIVIGSGPAGRRAAVQFARRSRRLLVDLSDDHRRLRRPDEGFLGLLHLDVVQARLEPDPASIKDAYEPYIKAAIMTPERPRMWLGGVVAPDLHAFAVGEVHP